MSDRERTAFSQTAYFGDDPLECEVGSWDEPNFNARPKQPPLSWEDWMWIEIALIGAVLVAALCGGAYAFFQLSQLAR